MNELFNSSAAMALVLVPLVSGLTELVKATSLKSAFYPHASAFIGFVLGGVGKLNAKIDKLYEEIEEKEETIGDLKGQIENKNAHIARLKR